MLKKSLILVFMLLGVLACTSEPKPSKQDVQKVIADNLPGFLELSSLDIQAMESIGSKVEPKYHARFVAKIKVLKPTYERIGRIGGGVDSDVVRLVLDARTTFDAYGKAVSVLDKDKWNTDITEIDFSVNNIGELLGKFQRPVIDGSGEHKDALEKFESLEKEKQLAAAEAEKAKADKTQQQAKAFEGKWIGSYICGQGSTGLTLSISTTLTGMSATFEFYPTKENPAVESGSFTMTGQFREDGAFSLQPGAWIKRPSGYNTVELRGRMNGRMNQLAGDVVLGGCQTFSVNKN